MRALATLAAFALIAACTAPAATAAEPGALAPFIGEWNSDLAACGTAENDSLLIIAPDAITFYESVGGIGKITEHGPREITIEGDPSLVGDEYWTGWIRLRVSEDGQTLEQITDGDPIPLMRCPG